MATPYSKTEVSLEELNKRKKKKRPGQPIADIMANQQMTANYPGRAGSATTRSRFGEQVKGGPAPIKKSLAPKKSLRPKARLPIKKQPFQMLSPREQSERRTELEQYKGMGIPEGAVPATAMPRSNTGADLTARDRAEMGMKKGRKVKKMMGGGMMKKKGMKKGGKVRGAGIARKGIRPAKMR